MHRIPELVLLATLCCPLAAQTSTKTQVYPASMEQNEGLGGTPFPFGLDKPCRMQALYESVQERGPTRIVTEFRLRPDWVSSTYTQKAKAWIGIGVIMSHSSRGFASVSTKFADNRGPDETTVFNTRKIALPAQTVSAKGPKPFDLSFKLDRPFIHRPTSGNLLVEFMIFNQPVGDYRLDSTLHCLSPSATFGKRDSTCFWTRKTKTSTEKAYMRLSSDLSIKLGNSVNWKLEDAPPRTVAVVFLGNDPKYAKWGPLSVPVPLAPFGAPGCYLNTDILLATTALTDAQGIGHATFALPPIHDLLNKYLHTQAFAAEFAANKLGLVFSLGHKAQICGPITATRVLAVGDIKAQYGSVLLGDAPVIQLVYQ